MFNYRILMAGLISASVLAFPGASPGQSYRKPPAPKSAAPKATPNPNPGSPAPTGFGSGFSNPAPSFNSPAQSLYQSALATQAGNQAFLQALAGNPMSSIPMAGQIYPTFPSAFNPNPWLTTSPYPVNPFQASPFMNPYQANPFMNSFQVSPFMNPYQANPFMNSFQVSPFMNPYQANPFVNSFQASPFMNPFQANPFVNPFQANPFQQNLFGAPGLGGTGVFAPGGGLPPLGGFGS